MHCGGSRPLLVTISALASILGTYMLKPVINRFILPGDIPGLVKILLVMGALYLCGALSCYVSFTVMRGEVVGIIGTNGSGKSTMLKIISGVLIPTSGRVRVDRRKVQLLTLGTGFDPELTGRENVYLNGAIIG